MKTKYRITNELNAKIEGMRIGERQERQRIKEEIEKLDISRFNGEWINKKEVLAILSEEEGK